MEFQDLNLRSSTERYQPSTEDLPIILSVPVESSYPWLKSAVAAVLIAGVGAAGYFVLRNRAVTAPVSAPTIAAPAASAPTDASPPLGAAAPAIDLPPLDESDDVVRGLVMELSSHPSVAAWLATDNLIRNFTVVVANIAAGAPAAGRVPALKPKGNFQVQERGEDLVINSRSFARYLPLATAASSINPQSAAMLYTMLKPRIEEAYQELGVVDVTFDQTLERAIVVLLKTPLPEGPVSVEPDGGVYRFADPALERLTPTQKLLIRFGPENQRAVQTSLLNVALALGIPPERLQ
jgi:hypothetical protein